MTLAPRPLERFSRRHLFGSGFGRALDEHFARLDGERGAWHVPRETASPAPATWGETDSNALGARLEPARRALVEAIAPASGGRLLDVSAGDGMLAAAAAGAGWAVSAVEPDPGSTDRGRQSCNGHTPAVQWSSELPAGATGGGFDAVVSCFADSHRAGQRRVARMLTHSVTPGGAIALTAWKGLMAVVMQMSAPGRHGRSEEWSRPDTARMHFRDFPGLSVRQHFMCWQFSDERAALAELSAPVRSETGRRRLREALPDLIEMYGRHCESGLALRADYVLVYARRPR